MGRGLGRGLAWRGQGFVIQPTIAAAMAGGMTPGSSPQHPLFVIVVGDPQGTPNPYDPLPKGFKNPTTMTGQTKGWANAVRGFGKRNLGPLAVLTAALAGGMVLGPKLTGDPGDPDWSVPTNRPWH